MGAKSKRQEELKKREKRSKILLAVLGVVFLAVGAFEVPSIMKMMNKKPPPGTTIDNGPSTGPTSSALPNVGGSTTSGGIGANGQLVNSDVPPPPADGGQLVSFSIFQAKNPFVPQVTAAGSTSSTPPEPTPADTGGGTDASTTTPTTTAPAATTPTTTTPEGGIVPPTQTTQTTQTITTPTTTTTPAAPVVAISVNGVVSKVSTGGTFPADAPVFRLASWGKGTVQVGIVGGSYAAGGQTLKLERGVPVTLENTTDGKRYKLVLLSTPSG
jgi:hypothetical protein